MTSRDGFHPDGSYIQRGIYACGYGVSLLQDLADLLFLFNGSSHENTDPQLSNIYKWVYDVYEPQIYDGAMMDMARGREVSRYNTQDHYIGHNAVAAIIRLSEMAPAGDAQRLKSMAKAWIQSDTRFSFYNDENTGIVVSAKNIMNDPNVMPRSELVKSKVYAAMDRAVQLWPGFGFGVSMSSSRIAGYESPTRRRNRTAPARAI